MKQWKLHTAWCVVTVVVAGAWGRWCISQRELQDPVPLKSHVSSSERAETESYPAASKNAPSGLPATAGAPSMETKAEGDALPSLRFKALSVEQIRNLIRSTVKSDWWTAALAVDRLADPALKKDLLLELASCPDVQIRVNSLSTLKAVAGAEAVPALQKALQRDPSSFVRQDCATMLGDLGGEGTIELLLHAVHDDSPKVRLASAGALNRLGQPGPAAELIPRLSVGLEHADSAIRRETVEDLGSLRSPLALPALVRALRDTSGDVRSAAIVGMADLNIPEVVPLLEGLLKDPVPEVAEAAKDGLDLIRDREQRKK